MEVSNVKECPKNNFRYLSRGFPILARVDPMEMRMLFFDPKANEFEEFRAGMSMTSEALWRNILKWCLSIVVVVCIALLGLLALQVWMKRDLTIEFIVPTNYRGTIIIDADDVGGVEPQRARGSIYTYEVPATGKLTVRDFGLFDRPHRVAAQYADGRPLRTINSGGNSENDIVLRYVGTHAEDRDQVFVGTVGTFQEHQQVMKKYGLLR